jgi:hypothetical protein
MLDAMLRVNPSGRLVLSRWRNIPTIALWICSSLGSPAPDAALAGRAERKPFRRIMVATTALVTKIAVFGFIGLSFSADVQDSVQDQP